MPRDAPDKVVAVEQTRKLQERLKYRVKRNSFDHGFHSPENQQQLVEIVPDVCLPKPGRKQAVEQAVASVLQFHQSKQRHPGVESAIGASHPETAQFVVEMSASWPKA